MFNRQHWPNNWVFILAAIGSAAGLGNLWRFPYLTYEYGGGAFVVAIIVANLLVGIPILLLELGLGQWAQAAAPTALEKVKKHFSVVGWFSLTLVFFIVSYYMAVMAWGVNYLASSFTVAWASDPTAYFFENVLQLSSGVDNVGGFAWPVVAGFVVAWLLVYFSVWRGVKSVSSVVKWTATIPFVVLAILIVRALTLEGAQDGLRLFLLPDWNALLSPQLWIAAFSQVFFSLSVGIGVMIAYGSFKPQNSEITKGALTIAAGNFLVSFMSGLVVFGTLGYMAAQQGVAVTEVVTAGPALVFVVFPQAIALLPALNALIAVLFFAMVLMLAIDSAFSMVEGIAAPFKDMWPNVSSKKIAAVVSLLGFIAGLPFVTKAGLYYLDILDHFVSGYGLVLSGLLEAIVIGWFWKAADLREFINKHSDIKLGKAWDVLITYLIPLFLIYLFVITLQAEFRVAYEGYPVEALLYGGVLPLILAPFIALGVKKLTNKERVSE